jgi:acyl dehydratase
MRTFSSCFDDTKSGYYQDVDLTEVPATTHPGDCLEATAQTEDARMNSDNRDHLFLDDLHVGQIFTSASHGIDADQIKRFALEFDPQPFHLSEDAAATSLFAGLAASGWHTAALTMRLLVNGGAPIAEGVIGAGGEIAWPQPTRPGDELHVVSEVVEIRPSRSKPDRGIVVLRSETRNQRGEVVQVLTAKLVVPRRQSGADQAEP